MCDRKRLGLTWPDSSGHVRRLPSTFELRARQFQVLELPRSFFPSCSKVIAYVLWIYYQSVWDVRKPIFWPHFVFEMNDLHPLCDSRCRRTCWFFPVESRLRSKKLKVSKLITSNHKPLTTVWRLWWTHQTWIENSLLKPWKPFGFNTYCKFRSVTKLTQSLERNIFASYVLFALF